MELWQSLTGQVELELTSAAPEQALERIRTRGIGLLDIRRDSELTLTFWISRKEETALRQLCEKQGYTLKRRRYRGLYWALLDAAKRPVLTLGLAGLLAATLYLPSRVLFFQVEGNTTVPTRKILEAAEEAGLGFGTARREVRSEKLKNALLAAVPELQWAGVNTTGCVATISVREKSMPEAAREPVLSSIVASRDGFVLSATVTRGTGLCAPGQTVKAGQTLISAYTDCGICIRATGAQGEVFAQTHRSQTAVKPLLWQEKGNPGGVKRKISLCLGKKRINLWKDSGILGGSCGRMCNSYTLTLPGGFRLPVTLTVETYTAAPLTPVQPEEAGKGLSEFARTYLLGQMVAGTIVNHRETVTEADGLIRLTGEYVCTEMIGRVRQEQMGDLYGKTN